MPTRKSLSPAASNALFYLSTLNEMHSSIERNPAAAASWKEDMRIVYEKQIKPFLEPYLPENETVRRAVETYQKLVKV